jgi:hypothetical protein
MSTRREFIATAATAAVGALGLPACSPGNGRDRYEQAVKATWRHTSGPPVDAQALQLELVRYATLAPSSHNTQCWKFRLEDRLISILPDPTRRGPVVDPDDHHLFVSLGCAAENLRLAAQAHGLQAAVRFDAADGDAVKIALEPGTVTTSPLHSALTRRQCTRTEYDGRALTNEYLRLLEQVGRGHGVEVRLLTDTNQMEAVLEYVIEGNTAQIDDPAFVEELTTWIRFSDAEAVRNSDGLFSRTSGNPALPRWLGRLFFRFFFTAHSENEKYARQMRSSAGVAVFVSERNDKAHWVETGRCYERFALQATALGVRNAFLNQPVEVAAVRPQFATYLGIGERRPDLIVRFGYSPEMPRSLRRPVEAVIV